MAETRMFPKMTPRSTGIERTAPNVRGVGAATSASSGVSAAPGASKKIHQHVLATREGGGARQIPSTIGGGRRADATLKVEIIDRQTGRVSAVYGPNGQ